MREADSARPVETCAECGYRHTPALDARRDEEVYAGGHPTTFQGSSGRRFSPGIATLRRLAARFRVGRSLVGDRPPPTRALDFGCGQGYYLEALAEAGSEAIGVEISHESARFARDRGLRVEIGTDNLEPESFDAIVSVHVLEHIPKVEATLVRATRLLATEARFHFEVPNAASVQAATFGRRWMHFEPDLHRHHFTSPALRTLLASHGFAVERSTTVSMEHGLLGWIQSLYNLVFPYNRFFRAVVLNRPLAEKLRCWPELVLLPLVGVAGSLCFLIETLLPGRGPVLRFEGTWSAPNGQGRPS